MNNRMVPEFIKIDESIWINIDQITSVRCGDAGYGIALTIYLSDGQYFSFYDLDEMIRVRDLLHTAISSLWIPLTFPDESNNGGEK